MGFLNSASTLWIKSAAALEDGAVLARIDGADAILLVGGPAATHGAQGAASNSSSSWGFLKGWRNSSLQAKLQNLIDRGVPIGGAWSTCDLGDGCCASSQRHSAERGRGGLHSAASPFLRLRPSDVFAHAVFENHFTARNRMRCLFEVTARRWESLSGSPLGANNLIGIGVDTKSALAVDARGNATLHGHGADSGRAYVLTPTVGPTRFAGDGSALDANVGNWAHSFAWQDVPIQKLDAYHGDAYDFVARRGGAPSQHYTVSLEASGQLRPRDPYHPSQWKLGFVSTDGHDRRHGVEWSRLPR